MRGLFVPVVIVLLVSLPASATTIIRGTFAEVVAEAEIAFEGVVADVRSRDMPSGIIVTDVTFRVVRPLKGTPPETITLTFAGGTIGNRTLDVSDMPKFARGDRDIVFAAPGRREISPLVRFMQGRFRVLRDDQLGREIVRQFDGTILGATAHVGAPPQVAAAAAANPPMAPSEFASAIVAEVARQRANGGR